MRSLIASGKKGNVWKLTGKFYFEGKLAYIKGLSFLQKKQYFHCTLFSFQEQSAEISFYYQLMGACACEFVL